ncbi:MAG: hypothetical protein ABEJ70_09565 [Halobacteriaceae archaeon]
MAVLSSLRDALTALQRNPVLFVAATLYAAVQVPALLLQVTGNPVLQLAASAYNLLLVLVAPFFVGGLFAMALEALDGPTSLSRLWRGGRTYYLRLLAIVLVGLVGYVVLGVGLGILFFALVVGGVVGDGGAGASLAVLAVVGLVALLFALVLLVVGFLLQFYVQAVVVDDRGALDALRRSYAVVRANVLAVLGFDAVALVLGVVAAAVPVGYVWLAAPGFAAMDAASWAVRLGYVVLTVALSVVLGAFGATYGAAFYVAVTADRG